MLSREELNRRGMQPLSTDEWMAVHKMKSFMRRPGARAYIRGLMMARLKAEVTAREVNAMLDKQGHGKTKQKVRRATNKKD